MIVAMARLRAMGAVVTCGLEGHDDAAAVGAPGVRQRRVPARIVCRHKHTRPVSVRQAKAAEATDRQRRPGRGEADSKPKSRMTTSKVRPERAGGGRTEDDGGAGPNHHGHRVGHGLQRHRATTLRPDEGRVEGWDVQRRLAGDVPDLRTATAPAALSGWPRSEWQRWARGGWWC